MMSKRRYLLGVTLTVLSVVIPIPLMFLIESIFQINIPSFAFSFAGLLGVMLMFEVASAFDLSARSGIVKEAFTKYPLSRDRVIYFASFIIALVFVYLPASANNHDMGFILLGGLLGIIAFFATCYIFGSRQLREGVTPTFVKRMFHRRWDDTGNSSLK